MSQSWCNHQEISHWTVRLLRINTPEESWAASCSEAATFHHFIISHHAPSAEASLFYGFHLISFSFFTCDLTLSYSWSTSRVSDSLMSFHFIILERSRNLKKVCAAVWHHTVHCTVRQTEANGLFPHWEQHNQRVNQAPFIPFVAESPRKHSPQPSSPTERLHFENNNSSIQTKCFY